MGKAASRREFACGKVHCVMACHDEGVWQGKSNFCKSPSQSPTATALPEGEPNKKPSFQLQSFYNFYNSLPVRGGRSQIAPTEKRWRFATEGNVFLPAQEAGGTRPPQGWGMFRNRVFDKWYSKKEKKFVFLTSIATTDKTNFWWAFWVVVPKRLREQLFI